MLSFDQNKKNKENLSEKAYTILKKMIVCGELKQGEVISISAMAEALNISRTPITNACHRLEADKFLKIIPKQGVSINTISVEDAREIYELRAAIESYSAKRSFETINQNDIDFLKECLERQKNYINEHNLKGFMNEDTKFHRHILKKYKNTQFFTILDTLLDRAYMIGLKSSENPERLKSSIEEHQKIIDALESGNKNEFVEAIEHNILSGYVSLTGNYELI